MHVAVPEYLGEYSSSGEIYPIAIFFSTLAWGSWLLCVAPLIWHATQRNVAAGSLMLWIILTNISLGINPLIWGHDDIAQWWDGKVWCDINVRIQIGAQVALGASIAMILRRLAKVMDTRNITVSLSRSSKLRGQLIEAGWCWGYPLVIILLYIPVQSARFNIWGIEGCISAYRPNMHSLFLVVIWMPVTMLAVFFYAVLLLVRLYRYRREFSRLMTARNTTRSRFLRLFLMCMVFLVIVVPYSMYPFWYYCNEMVLNGGDYEYTPGTIFPFPSGGQIHIDKWGQIVMGYVAALLFGTGTDAYNTYKKMLLAIGLGKIFPSLYVMCESGSSTPSSYVSARTWTSSCVGKAKSYFSKGGSTFSSFGGSTFASTRNNSVDMDSMDATVRQVLSTASVFPDRDSTASNPSMLKRLFSHTTRPTTILPLFTQRSTTTGTAAETGAVQTVTEVFTAQAWASKEPQRRCDSEPIGVVVFREVHLDEEVRDSTGNKSADEWMLRP
ncbi:STE3-domain-containing protein [Didymella exigua CBS 183.55]|uniref:STE3-domain-containing protein n=1 Tax=Didymella exigua CBS 183.55 TaxID=1150837 RepID=A0A6A5S4E9_9PLEO|nr:STE3-domain-containing protein [Didymella exigua CBS 183.55]KAF1933356.1 STE3-domain-containing protein [Didymella exigua CBS 183.55]